MAAEFNNSRMKRDSDFPMDPVAQGFGQAPSPEEIHRLTIDSKRLPDTPLDDVYEQPVKKKSSAFDLALAKS